MSLSERISDIRVEVELLESRLEKLEYLLKESRASEEIFIGDIDDMRSVIGDLEAELPKKDAEIERLRGILDGIRQAVSDGGSEDGVRFYRVRDRFYRQAPDSPLELWLSNETWGLSAFESADEPDFRHLPAEAIPEAGLPEAARREHSVNDGTRYYVDSIPGFPAAYYRQVPGERFEVYHDGGFGWTTSAFRSADDPNFEGDIREITAAELPEAAR